MRNDVVSMIYAAMNVRKAEKIALYERRAKRLSMFLLIMFMFSSATISSFACTVFNKKQGKTVLAGNNEDWMYSAPASLWFAAAEDEKSYGRMCFGLYSYVQGGMNEKGLFFDMATCPESKVPYFEGKPQLDMDFCEVILSKCATVTDVVKMVRKYNIPDNFHDHVIFADRLGNSMVMEWVEDELRFIPKKGNYQLITNFWLSNPDLGGYPCNRFSKAKSMLEAKKDISVSYFADILKATRQDWGNGGTIYSNVYDLSKGEAYIYYQGDFNKNIKYNLKKELKKLQKGDKSTYMLEELFK